MVGWAAGGVNACGPRAMGLLNAGGLKAGAGGRWVVVVVDVVVVAGILEGACGLAPLDEDWKRLELEVCCVRLLGVGDGAGGAVVVSYSS